MKQILTLFTVFTITMSAGTAQTKNDGAKEPKNVGENITVKKEESLSLKESEFDFGKIPQGKPVTHVFEVTNIGKDPLKISNVTASCGCTTPEWERDKAIEPNGNTTIKVGYNAASAGAFTKTITIIYNEGQTKVITIKGEVWATPAASAPENKALQDLKNK